MTLPELQEALGEGKVIMCDSRDERNEVLKYLDSMGMTLGNNTRNLINSDGDIEFHFKNIVWYEPLACLSVCTNEHKAILYHGGIPYEEVAHLVDPMVENQAMTEDEFDEALAELMGASYG